MPLSDVLSPQRSVPGQPAWHLLVRDGCGLTRSQPESTYAGHKAAIMVSCHPWHTYRALRLRSGNILSPVAMRPKHGMPSGCIVPVPVTETCHAAQPLAATAEQGHSLDTPAPQHQNSRAGQRDPGTWQQDFGVTTGRRDAGEQQKGML